MTAQLKVLAPREVVAVPAQVNSADGYETRTYEPATWAYVKMKGVRRPDEAVMEGIGFPPVLVS